MGLDNTPMCGRNWKPNSMGYTLNKCEAGRYSQAEALEIVKNAGPGNEEMRFDDSKCAERDKLRELIRRHATGDITADELHALANVWPCEHRALQEPPDDGLERLEACAKCGLTL